VRFRITKPNETAFRNDGNNVNVDTEMAALSENAILYQVYTQLVSRQFRKLRDMLREA
jgi:flagellar basal-body rod protein FlgB